jgi:hypothetical protein
MEFISLNPRPMYILSFVPFLMFIQLKIVDIIQRQQVLILGNRKSSFEQALLRLVKSTHILYFPFFFLTSTTFDSQVGYFTGWMTPMSSRR